MIYIHVYSYQFYVIFFYTFFLMSLKQAIKLTVYNRGLSSIYANNMKVGRRFIRSVAVYHFFFDVFFQIFSYLIFVSFLWTLLVFPLLIFVSRHRTYWFVSFLSLFLFCFLFLKKTQRNIIYFYLIRFFHLRVFFSVDLAWMSKSSFNECQNNRKWKLQWQITLPLFSGCKLCLFTICFKNP